MSFFERLGNRYTSDIQCQTAMHRGGIVRTLLARYNNNPRPWINTYPQKTYRLIDM
jgi:hypothetical protein